MLTFRCDGRATSPAGRCARSSRRAMTYERSSTMVRPPSAAPHPDMALLLALTGAYGVFLVFSARAYGWRGVGLGPRLASGEGTRRHHAREWLRQAGLGEVRTGEFLAVMAALFVIGAGVAYALFGGVVPGVAAGLFAA